MLLLSGSPSALADKPTDRIVPAPVPATEKPRFVLVMLENKYAASALDQKNLPFLWRLAHEGAYLSDYHAIGHPSQPNYVALISGSREGVRNDSTVRLYRAHLGQRLDSWRSYAEGYPGGTCDPRARIGLYVRKHEPFMSFADIQDDKKLCRKYITGFDDFLADARAHSLPQFSLVIPDLDSDAHSGPLAVSDAWLARHFSALLDDPAFRRDVVLIVTFDEDGEPWPYRRHGDNRVYAALWGDRVVPGEIHERHDHYDLLRTIESALGVAPMATGDRNAKVIAGVLR